MCVRTKEQRVSKSTMVLISDACHEQCHSSTDQGDGADMARKGASESAWRSAAFLGRVRVSGPAVAVRDAKKSCLITAEDLMQILPQPTCIFPVIAVGLSLSATGRNDVEKQVSCMSMHVHAYMVYIHTYTQVHALPTHIPWTFSASRYSAEPRLQVCILSIWRRREQNKACFFTAGTFAHELQISVCQAFLKR